MTVFICAWKYPGETDEQFAAHKILARLNYTESATGHQNIKQVVAEARNLLKPFLPAQIQEAWDKEYDEWGVSLPRER